MTIGPNFSNELAASGLFALQMAWTPDGTITYGSSVTSAQKSAVAAVLAAHNPAKPDLTQFVSVTSSGASTLNGTYPISLAAQQQITSEATYIQATGGTSSGKFSNGQSTRGWPDSSGTLHTFNLTQFINFAEAVAAYVDSILVGQAAVAQQQAPTWPSPVTIP